MPTQDVFFVSLNPRAFGLFVDLTSYSICLISGLLHFGESKNRQHDEGGRIMNYKESRNRNRDRDNNEKVSFLSVFSHKFAVSQRVARRGFRISFGIFYPVV